MQDPSLVPSPRSSRLTVGVLLHYWEVPESDREGWELSSIAWQLCLCACSSSLGFPPGSTEHPLCAPSCAKPRMGCWHSVPRQCPAPSLEPELFCSEVASTILVSNWINCLKTAGMKQGWGKTILAVAPTVVLKFWPCLLGQSGFVQSMPCIWWLSFFPLQWLRISSYHTANICFTHWMIFWAWDV